MKIDLDHPAAISANKSDKKKQPWEVVTQSWKVQAETKGLYKESFSAFLEYAARCYIPVGYASVEYSNRSKILLMVAVPLTYRQLMAAIGVSQPTASKIISDMKSIGCKYESQLLLMPAVNQDLYEIIDSELKEKVGASRGGVRKVFGSGKGSQKSEVSGVEPGVLDKLNRGRKKTDKSSEGAAEEPGDTIIDDECEDEEKVVGDRIARCREIGESGLRVLF